MLSTGSSRFCPPVCTERSFARKRTLGLQEAVWGGRFSWQEAEVSALQQGLEPAVHKAWCRLELLWMAAPETVQLSAPAHSCSEERGAVVHSMFCFRFASAACLKQTTRQRSPPSGGEEEVANVNKHPAPRSQASLLPRPENVERVHEGCALVEGSQRGRPPFP